MNAPPIFRAMTKICLIGLVLQGCVAVARPTAEGMIATDGVTIQLEDGTTLQSGKIFTPPFQTKSYVESGNSDKLTRLYEDHLKRGAKQVRVTVPGLSNPLYGVLALNPPMPGAVGPGARSYRIEVPTSYVQAARDGKVSVVYELVENEQKNMQSYGWILWLSDRPL